jgi:uracil permease
MKEIGRVMPEDELPLVKTAVFSVQQLFAVVSATILVPLIVGLSPGVALFTMGAGTIIGLICTRWSYPMVYGSSFAFIGALIATSTAYGWGATSIGVVASGVFYVIVSSVIMRAGSAWLDKVFPPVVIGSVIMTIGMCLLPGTITATFGAGENYSLTKVVIGFFTLGVIALVSTLAKGFFKAIPILIGIVAGFIFTVILSQFTPTDFAGFQAVADAPWIIIPVGPGFGVWSVEPSVIAVFLIVSLATIIEHIGDNFTLSAIVGREFYKKPGLAKTILGDGLATVFAGLLGSVPNTSYGECSATQALSRVHSVKVILGAALLAVVLSFCGKFSVLISVVPWSVLNGSCLALYGLISASGLRRLIDAKVDLNKTRNLLICSSILTIGIGGVLLRIGEFSLSGVALASVIGIALNLILPKEKE